MNKAELIEYLEGQGYYEITDVPGKGLCGLRTFLFTVGLCYGLESDSYAGRYCYPHEVAGDALIALTIWKNSEIDVEGDPVGEWVKYKGIRGEYTNPNL